MQREREREREGQKSRNTLGAEEAHVLKETQQIWAGHLL